MVSTVQTAVGQYLRNISNAVFSTFEGMAVTMSWMFRRPMTIQYPDKIEKPIEETLPDCYRGILEVDTGVCTGCTACMKACPIQCIRIEVGKNAETAERFLQRFDIYVARCMFCGLCSEACPTGAIHHTSHFEIANDKLDNLLLHYVPGEPIPVYKPKKDVEPVRQPKGQPYLAVRALCAHAWRKEDHPDGSAPAGGGPK